MILRSDGRIGNIVEIETPEGMIRVVGRRVWVRTREEFDALCNEPSTIAGYFDPKSGGIVAVAF